MDLLGALGILVRVVETGSFSASPVSASSARLRSPARSRSWRNISASASFTVRRESSPLDSIGYGNQGPRSAAQSATNHRLQLRGIAVALDLDRSSCAFDLGEIGSGQFDGRCADILLSRKT